MQTTKQPCDERKNQIDLIHQVEGQNNYQNFLLFDFHKTIEPTEGTLQGEDSPEASPEEEASREVEDIREEEEYHPEDHQEALGDRRPYLCRKCIKENW